MPDKWNHSSYGVVYYVFTIDLRFIHIVVYIIIHLYGCITACLSIQQWKDTCTVWSLLWMKLPYTYAYAFSSMCSDIPCGLIHMFPSDKWYSAFVSSILCCHLFIIFSQVPVQILFPLRLTALFLFLLLSFECSL